MCDSTSRHPFRHGQSLPLCVFLETEDESIWYLDFHESFYQIVNLFGFDVVWVNKTLSNPSLHFIPLPYNKSQFLPVVRTGGGHCKRLFLNFSVEENIKKEIGTICSFKLGYKLLLIFPVPFTIHIILNRYPFYYRKSFVSRLCKTLLTGVPTESHLRPKTCP